MMHLAETPGARAYLAHYIAARTGETAEGLTGPFWYAVLGAVQNDRITGAVMFNLWRGPSVETHWAGDPGWLTALHLRQIFDYPFNVLGVRRVTGIIRKANLRARDSAERIGFKLEGVMRHGFDDDDACVYGMTRGQCKWIDTRGHDGKICPEGAGPDSDRASAIAVQQGRRPDVNQHELAEPDGSVRF